MQPWSTSKSKPQPSLPKGTTFITPMREDAHFVFARSQINFIVIINAQVDAAISHFVHEFEFLPLPTLMVRCANDFITNPDAESPTGDSAEKKLRQSGIILISSNNFVSIFL